MAVSSEYVAAIRQRLRLTTDDFDNEITDLINAARADLALGGVAHHGGNGKPRRESLELGRPVVYKRRRAHDKARIRLPLGMAGQKKGNELQRLA